MPTMKDIEDLRNAMENKRVVETKTILDAFAYSFYNRMLHADKKDIKPVHIEMLETILQAMDFLYISGKESPLRDDEYDKLHLIYHNLTGKHITNKYEDTKQKLVPHVYPVLKGTLDKVHYFFDKDMDGIKSHESVETWLRRALGNPELRNELKNSGNPDISIFVYPKADGVSLVLRLVKVTDDYWKCTSAITRGYSDTGEGIDVTAKFKNFNMASLLPGRLCESEKEIGVKVEAIIPKVAYDEVNELIDPNLNTDMRSIVSGIIRAEVVNEKLMELVMLVPLSYYFPKSGDDYMPTILFPKTSPIVPFTFTHINPMEESVEDITAKVKELCDELIEATSKEGISFLPYAIDGLVIRFVDLPVMHILGRDNYNCVNNYEVAYKFPPKQEKTILRNVRFQVGLLGAITPVAEFDTRVMNNRKVSNASLGSIDRMEALHLHIGDEITLKYDIIPYVDKDPDAGDFDTAIEAPHNCPICGEELEFAPILMCTNPKCPSREIGKILNFCQRMKFKGFGPAVVETLFNAGIVRNIQGLYSLDPAAVAELPDFGTKTAKKLKKETEEVRKVKPARLLGALGIRSVGERKFEPILDIYYIDELLDMTPEKDLIKLTKIKGIGEKTALAVLEGLEENRDLIKVVLEHVKLLKKEAKKNGKNVVFTGVRNQAFAEYLESLGFEIKDKPNNNTTVVITSSPPKESVTTRIADEKGIRKLDIISAYSVFNYPISGK